jgi:hypothetical protein
MTNSNDVILSELMFSKTRDMAALIETMRANGWVPVTPERQPYRVDLIGQLMPALAAAGFVQALTPTFMAGGRANIVRSARMPAEIVATDKPEDLPDVNKELLPLMIELMRKSGYTHIHAVIVERAALYGLLPPTCLVGVRVAKVKMEEPKVC